MPILWSMLTYPVDVLFAAPTCTPWSTNARAWTEEARDHQRSYETSALKFLRILILVQTLLGRHWMIEQPAGSELFDSEDSPLSSLLSQHSTLLERHTTVIDQCMYGAVMDDLPVKKRTRLESSFPPHHQPRQCDHSHRHCVLRGNNAQGTRTAQAAMYPHPLCHAILDEVSHVSAEIRDGGSTGINTDSLDIQDQGGPLFKILYELRVLAARRGPHDIGEAPLTISWCHGYGCSTDSPYLSCRRMPNCISSLGKPPNTKQRLTEHVEGSLAGTILG